MTKRISPAGMALAAALLVLSGCSNVVEILEPLDANAPQGGFNQAPAPVTKFVVKVGPNYKGSFSADLDGGAITTWFSPAAAPNSTVVATVPTCFSGGAAIPHTILRKHELIARASSGNPGISIDNDIAEFVPPAMQFQPASSITVPRGQTVTVQMNLTTGPATPVPVTLEPSTSTVSVNGVPAGTPALATLPNNTVGTFSITGVAPGSFVISAKAKGVQCGGVSGHVT